MKNCIFALIFLHSTFVAADYGFGWTYPKDEEVRITGYQFSLNGKILPTKVARSMRQITSKEIGPKVGENILQIRAYVDVPQPDYIVGGDGKPIDCRKVCVDVGSKSMPPPYSKWTALEFTHPLADGDPLSAPGSLKLIPDMGNQNIGLEFDGEDDGVLMGAVQFTGSDMSITAWVLPVLKENDQGRIASKAYGVWPEQHEWMVSFLGEKLRFRLNTDGITTAVLSDDIVVSGEWQHVAAVYDGVDMILFRNGKEVGRDSKTGEITTVASNVKASIGMNPPGSHYLRGVIDNVRIYDRALSLGEVVDDMVGNAVPPMMKQWDFQEGTPGKEISIGGPIYRVITLPINTARGMSCRVPG